MENYKNLVLQNEIGNAQMIRPISKDGISIIDTYPLDVVQRLGKYQFIYDYSADTSTSSDPIFYNINRVNFSKGDVVEVVRFQLGSAMINNPNYKEYAPIDNTAPKTGIFSGLNFGELLKGLTVGNRKELEIPKEYLQKVDDSTAVTLPTGVNYGENPKPQPKSIKSIGYGTQLGQVLETNVTYTISKPFQFIKSYTNVRPLYELGGAGMLQYAQTANYETLPIGMEVTGNLIRQKSITGKSIYGMPETYIYYDVLLVSGMGQSGQLEIPVEYLTKKNPTNIPTNNGAVVPVKNNNKNLLMIVGAFLVGYILFNKETPSN